jgi:hypothetical protein
MTRSRPAPSFTLLFPACRDALHEAQKPLHYHDLTLRGLQRIGVSRKDVSFSAVCEDVREKLLCTKRYDTFYTGKPLYLAALHSWFKTEQETLFHIDRITIPGHAEAGARGAYEGLMRSAHMLQKTTMDRRAAGLVLEQHVAYWFKDQYPAIYLPPENEGQWERPCDHDFKLDIHGNIIKLDVSGPRYHGGYGNPGNGKHATDYHLLCEIQGRDVCWLGVTPGRNYNAVITPETTLSPIRMVVWLNCIRDGIDYQIVKARAMGHSAATSIQRGDAHDHV